MPRAPRRSAAARRPAEPTSPSPPQTPTTTSPKAGRKAPPQTRMASKQSPTASRRGVAPKNLRPLGGTHFSYSRNLYEDLSPCSSEKSSEEEEPETDDDASASDKADKVAGDVDDDDESGDADDDDDDNQETTDDSEDEEEEDDSEDDEEKLQIPVSNPFQPLSDHVPPPFVAYTRIAATITIAEDHLIIEDLGEYELDSEDGEVLLPYAFEYPESEPSRSRSRTRRDLDPMFQRNFEDLNPFDDTDDELDEDDEFERNRQAQRMERRIRRMKSGSISKRTISERGSDSDGEDVLPYCEAADAGPLFRRTRRKTDRHSMQFSGQFPERIEELKEPNSDDEIIFEDAELFARELPFWTFMDVDSE
ncbi:hypothetical protein Micbo1qcDRAFT_164855 [Microdochium bolleyi]|uniref:Uncharacterized protein n=1 Tax=Microdochium bolleyi TaxID=196109 RepID=A0A136IZR3_9PEZI|nr:hypothetical protein Micbo1qcDRAFT_164855 [Microdochium bolleyi]